MKREPLREDSVETARDEIGKGRVIRQIGEVRLAFTVAPELAQTRRSAVVSFWDEIVSRRGHRRLIDVGVGRHGRSRRLALCLPSGYRRNLNNAYFDDNTPLTYQPHVYRLARFLAERSGARAIVDVGCGAGGKLLDFPDSLSVVGLDHGPNLARFRETLAGRQAHAVECDLNDGIPSIPEETLSDAVVICSDVVEHLVSPLPLVRQLASWASTCRYLLLSTPARDRARHPRDAGPPANPAHAQEWTLVELLQLLASTDLTPAFCGYTVNTHHHLWKTTALVIAGRETEVVRFPPVPVTAIVKTRNDDDGLESVVGHLRSEGVLVHLMDEWSSDGTYAIGERLASGDAGVTIERFPTHPTVGEWPSVEQLQRTVGVATERGHGWYLHYDSDELRVAPWGRLSLAEAIGHVDRLGYNAIDFTVVDFRYLSGERLLANPLAEMRFFEFGRRPGHFVQVKCWKYTGQNVELASSGGHEAVFERRRVFPLKFLTKHYSLRGADHARRKIFEERLPRVQAQQAERGWQVHYNLFSDRRLEGWGVEELIPWHPPTFETEYLVERLSGIGLEVR